MAITFSKRNYDKHMLTILSNQACWYGVSPSLSTVHRMSIISPVENELPTWIPVTLKSGGGESITCSPF